jgi:hypothetical protein
MHVAAAVARRRRRNNVFATLSFMGARYSGSPAERQAMLSPEGRCEMGLGGWLGGGSDPLPIPPLFKGREEKCGSHGVRYDPEPLLRVSLQLRSTGSTRSG